MKARHTLATLAVAVGVAAPTTGAATTQPFRAEFHDSPTCPGVDICGKGIVHGFGTVTTTLVFTGVAPSPDGCLTATAERDLALDRDGSTLRLALAGTICRHKVEGTFQIVGGTGAFAGATGGGTIRGVSILGEPSDSVHFEGSLTLL
jgi:hypothetical protein